MNRTMKITAALVVAMLAGAALANNLTITNVTVKGRDTKTAWVKFDISWENSWRYASEDDPLYLHDAAWVFFKVKPEGEGQEWQRVLLEGSGINPEGYETGTGTAIEMVVPSDRTGMFIRRAADGTGTTAVQQVSAVWNFGSNGLHRSQRVKIQAMGLEMCYVAKGEFKVGDGAKDAGQLYEGGTGADPQPFAITNAGPIECGDEAGKLWGASTSGDTSMGGSGTIPASFPNGYNAFYCMKYMVTQGQYADFLNLLSRAQQAARFPATTVGYYMSNHAFAASPEYRNTVQLVSDPGSPAPRVYGTVTPDRACNFLTWGHLGAFADWSGLRPMTELEYEKACRGPMEPVEGEFAWGTKTAVNMTWLSGTDGSGTEVPGLSNANCQYSNALGGPARVGIFARPGATREEAGAGYWGALELCGSLWERTVSIGTATGRSFAGTHGDGALSAGGDANATSWPSPATGLNLRGSGYVNGISLLRTSDRAVGALEDAGTTHNLGGRVVRTAP